MAPDRSSSLRREMSITPAEFFRTLSGFIDPEELEIRDRIAFIRTGDGSIEIELSEEGERRIGALVLPVLQVDFRFQSLSSPDVAAFMERFELHFRRGGG